MEPVPFKNTRDNATICRIFLALPDYFKQFKINLNVYII